VATIVLLLFYFGTALSIPVAAEEVCSEVPTQMVLAPGQTVHLDGKVFSISALHYPPLDGVGRGHLEIDLIAEFTKRGTTDPRHGTYVPHLDVSYRLTLLGGGELTRGTFPLAMSHLGHTYGGHVSLDGLFDEGVDVDPMNELMLELSVRRQPGSPNYVGDCPKFPLTLSCKFREMELPNGRELEFGTDDPSEDVRFTLLSEFDPNGAQDSSDVWGYSDGSTFLAIMGKTNGTSFIDITDPQSPVEVGFISGPSSSWRDIKTYLNYAYITTEGTGSGEGMQIVDLSTPTSPVLVNTYSATFTSAHNIYIDTAIGQAWIWGSSNSSRILDLSADPVNPVDVGEFAARYVHDGYVASGLGCFSEINNDLQEVADTSDPSNVQTLSTWTTPGAATHNCWANDAWDQVSTTDETGGGHVAVYDVTDINSPGVLQSEYNPNPVAIVHNLKYDDDDNERIAISFYALGGKYVDLHRPTAPVELASYDTFPSGEGGFNGNWGVYAFDPRGYIYLSDVDRGLFVLRYDPDGGTLSGVVRDAVSSDVVPDAQVVLLSDGTSAVSASDGVYAFYAPEGPTQIRVAAWGFRTRILDAGSMPLDGRLDVDVDLTRLARSEISGTVTRSDNALGIGGVKIGLPAGNLEVVTAADGSYSFTEVAVGQQLLTAEAFGFSSAEARVLVDEAGSATLDFVLTPAAFVDDAETNQGWSLGVGGDTAGGGLWERVDPNGTGGGSVQPEDDATSAPGTVAFITGQSNPGASTEANDVEFGFTTLMSPTIDASSFGAATVRYKRWLSTSAGVVGGGTLRGQISSNGGSTWTNMDVSTVNANFWGEKQFNVAGLVPVTNQLRVRFRAESSSGFENFKVLEVGVDDFDVVEACTSRFNPGSADSDSDNIVDDCDACPSDPGNDVDGDGFCGDVDNAPFVSNADQLDADADGVGDAVDNCVGEVNPDQRDLDLDGLGDPCDPDTDGDGLDDVSDDDRDNDGVLDVSDICPDVPDASQFDRDLDGTGDACDNNDGEVGGLLVDADRIVWEPEAGSDSYNVYRGDLGASALLRLAACRVAGLPGAFAIDPDLPAPGGDGFFYLVARISGGVEGTLGNRTDGSPRSVDSPCP
jgi:choice-of-anchor B domain-containing protein